MPAAHLMRDPNGAGLAGRINAALARWPLVFVVVMAAIYGGGRADYAEFVQFSADPFTVSLPVDKQFLYSSPLNLWIATALAHLIGHQAAYAVTACLAALAVAPAWRLYARNFPPASRAPLLFVVLSTPIMLVATKWIGKGDLFLIAAYLIVLSRGGGGFIAGLAACLMVLAHRELGAIVLAGHCFLRREFSWAAVLGGAMGIAVMWIYQQEILASVSSTRATIILTQGSEILRHNATQPIAHIVFGFSWFWMFLFLRLQERPNWRILCFVLFAFALAFVTIDFTRDLLVISLPLIFVTAEWVVQSGQVSSALPVTWPFPILFMIQVQLLKATALFDTGWTSRLIPH